MKLHPLGHSDLIVPDLCLGTMTYGTQTAEPEAHRQMDTALEAGITFFDTAEMYPVNPISAETVGLTESIIGNWIAASGKRDRIVLATKMSGKNGGMVRGGEGITPKTLRDGLEGSLRRLRTETIDLYQFHWPNRGSYHFRQYWAYDPSQQSRSEAAEHMAECLDTLKTFRAEGKIRHFGLSNESAWGTSEWLRLARASGAPEVCAIQNEYSLMCRIYDTDLAELSVNENIGLLAFSPLATGLLTGKYQNGAVPDGSRRSLNETLGGRWSARVEGAVAAYLEIADRHGLDPVHMALAWCQTRPFMGSAIFGATTQAQLDRIIAGKDVTLTQACMDDIAAAYKAHPMPF